MAFHGISLPTDPPNSQGRRSSGSLQYGKLLPSPLDGLLQRAANSRCVTCRTVLPRIGQTISVRTANPYDLPPGLSDGQPVRLTADGNAGVTVEDDKGQQFRIAIRCCDMPSEYLRGGRWLPEVTLRSWNTLSRRLSTFRPPANGGPPELSARTRQNWSVGDKHYVSTCADHVSKSGLEVPQGICAPHLFAGDVQCKIEMETRFGKCAGARMSVPSKNCNRWLI